MVQSVNNSLFFPNKGNFSAQNYFLLSSPNYPTVWKVWGSKGVETTSPNRHSILRGGKTVFRFNNNNKNHVTTSSRNTLVLIPKQSSWAWRIIKSNMNMSNGKSVTLILAGVVFLTGLECVCVRLSRWPYRNRPDRIKPLCWTPLHLFTKACLFLSEYEFLASLCLGAGLGVQEKERCMQAI